MKILFLSIYLILVTTSIVYSQKISTPLEPASPPKQFELGILLGLGGNNQSGDYIPGKYFDKCNNCNFTSGSGFGSSLGIVAHRDIIAELQWGASLSIVFSDIKSEFQEIEIVPIQMLDNKFDYRPIPFKNTADFEFSFLEFTPFMLYSPINFFFVKVGFTTALLVNSHIKQSKELLKFKDTLSSGEIVDLYLDSENPFVKVVDDRDIPQTNSFQMFLKPALGFNFKFSERFLANPYFEYSIPLSKISNLQDTFKIGYWRIILEFKYAITLRETPIKL